jgi:hypothetical protein
MTWPANLSKNSCAVQRRQKAKGRARRPFVEVCCGASSALARLEARVALADHEYLATTAHDFAVAVARFGGF